MRAFIALNFSLDFKDKVSFYHKFRIKGIKWVETENIHLTLTFLGDVINEKNIFLVKEALKPVSSYKSFKVSVSGIGAFPNLNFPKVLWIAIDRGKEEINGIYSIIKENLVKGGFIFEDKFFPHITIGRIKSEVKSEELIKIKNFKFNEDIEDIITGVDMMSSQLTSRGPIYKIIYSEKFQG